MAEPIRFYFDFASPYAYCATARIEAIGAEFGRTIDWRPTLLWAVFRAHGITAPFDSPTQADYILHDMARSAAFHGLPYHQPVKLPLSAHMATRLYFAVRERDEEQAIALRKAIFQAFFVEQKDISQQDILVAIAAEIGIPEAQALEGINGPIGRALLEKSVEEAVAAKVVGSPHFIVDGEHFFGADRLPQLRWHLGGRAA